MQSTTLNDESIQVLYDLGLTRLQVDAFLALLRLGASTPSQIARACSIHRVEGYRVMKELSKLGLVEQRLSDGRSTFCAVSPRSMLSSLISVKTEEVKRLRDRIAICIPALESIRNEGNSELEADKETHFRVALGEKKSREIMVKMWRQARREVLIMLPKEIAYRFLAEADPQKTLRAMARRHIKLKIIVELDRSNSEIISALCDGCEVRCADELFAYMTIVDNTQILLGGGGISSGETSNDATVASLWTDNASFVYSMKRFTEELWKNALSVEQKISSLRSGEAPERTEVIRSKAEIDKLFGEIVGRAKNRLLISMGSDSMDVMKSYLVSLKSSSKISLRTKVMMKIDDNSQVSVVDDILRFADVKHCQQIPFTALINDSELIMFTGFGSEREVLWINTRDLVEKFYSVAKAIFDEGKSASTRIWEVKTGGQIGEGLFRQLYSSRDTDKEKETDQSEFETTLTQGEGNRIYRKMPKITYYRSYDSRTSKLQAGYAILEPGADSGFYFHPGEEVTIVIEGRITVDVGKDTYELTRGDTLHYASGLPHRMRNAPTNNEVARIFTVDYPPTF